MSAEVGQPLGNQEQLLEIYVSRRDGLRSVRWNGTPFPRLVQDKVNAQARQRRGGYEGEFGVYCANGSCVITGARFLPLE